MFGNGGLDKLWPLTFDGENAGSLHLKTVWLPDDTPDAVDVYPGKKVDTVEKDQGFEGQMVKDKRTGKARQYYEGG